MKKFILFLTAATALAAAPAMARSDTHISLGFFSPAPVYSAPVYYQPVNYYPQPVGYYPYYPAVSYVYTQPYYSYGHYSYHTPPHYNRNYAWNDRHDRGWRDHGDSRGHH